MMRIVSVLVLNQTGVLLRLTGMLTKRQINIESMSVGPTEKEGVSRMTFLIRVRDDKRLETLLKQISKQVDVLQVSDLSNERAIIKELALIKVVSNGLTRVEINGIIEPFRASVIDVSRDSLTVQVTGGISKIEAMIDLLSPYGIKEITRTGIAASTSEGRVKKIQQIGLK
ncbi:MAG TPA: acetolactate synthase small subunit [Cerasibacillus sp.]|uniref:acetolactate synthase small subunit n=1 Tax=Cerasibacillus sp. TaxID=2498711 RepID=UPI002F40379F